MRNTFGKGRVNKWDALVNRKKGDDQSTSTQKMFDEDATYVLSVHQQDNYVGADIAFNPDTFPNIKLHDKLLVSDFDGNQLIIQVQKESFANELKNKNFHLSISKAIAENYNLSLDISNKMNIKVKILEDMKNFELDTIEINFKDQVIYRRDLYKLEKKLVGTCLYTGKIVVHEGVKGKVIKLVSKIGELVHSGIVTERTKLVFRTLSSRYYVIIELSKEMCDSNINGELYLEKAIKTIKALLQRMDVMHTHHKIVFILSARLYYPQFKNLEEAYAFIGKLSAEKEEELNRLSTNCTTFQVDTRGKVFQDVYHRVNTREVKRDWEGIISKIKETIFGFLRYINWKSNINQRLKTLINTAHVIEIGRVSAKSQINRPTAQDNKSIILEKNDSLVPPTLEPPNLEDSSPQVLSRSSSQHLNMLNESSSHDDELDPPEQSDDKGFCIPVECEIASSEYSNLLESLNLALSMYNHHQLSRTLTTTGHTIAVITAGEGKYFVDSNLARLTKECMVLGRVYCNILTMKEDPPYKSPLFVFQDNPQNFYADLNNDETKELLNFDKLIQEVQTQMVSTNSMESFATFSISEQIDQKDGFPFFKNYVGISHVKDANPQESLSQLSNKLRKNQQTDEFMINEGNNKDHYSIDFEEAAPKSKQIYWLNFIPGFSSEALNSHSLIFSFPKNNPDPFLSLSFKSAKIYQPSFQIQQLVKDLSKSPMMPKNTGKIAEMDKFLNNLVRPNTSIFQGEANNLPKDVLIHKMNTYDSHIFNDTRGDMIDINAYNYQEALPVLDLEPDSDRSSGRSPDSFSNVLTSPLSSGAKVGTVAGLSVEKKGSAGSQAAVFANFKSFGDKRDNSTVRKSFSEAWDEMHMSNKQYSHYKLRWARIENAIGAEAMIQKNQHKTNVKLPPNIYEFESVWKNLSIPPLLPLHTYFFPSEAELNDDRKYQKLQYYFNLTGDIKQKIDDFMDELVSQRLTLDFQNVDGESLDSFGKSSNVMHFNKFFRLSWGTVHHRIYLNSTDNLMCHIYTKKKERKIGNNTFNVNFFPTYYRYLLFNDRGKGLVRKSVIFDGIKQINWNRFDLYVSNSMKDENSEKKDLINYRVKVISLIMLPMKNDDKTTKSEGLIPNFCRVMEALQEKLSEYGFRSTISGYSIVYKRSSLRQSLEKEGEPTTRIVKVFIGGQASGFNHFYFEYDRYYCPKAGYHFKLYWFSCSGSTITDLIRSMSAILRNGNFALKFIPERYRILHAHPFESNLRINCKTPNIMKSLKKVIQQPPFNFVLDTFLTFTSFIHETGSILLYFFDTFVVWKDNRLIDTNIASAGDSDITMLYERLFRNLIASIHCLEILHGAIDKVLA